MTNNKDVEKIVLAIDLDETVFSYVDALKDVVAEDLGRIIVGDPEFYSLWRSGWFDSEEDFRAVHGRAVTEWSIYQNLVPYRGAVDTIRELSKSGYENNIITSRFVNPGQHEKVVADTVRSLEINRIPYSNLLFLANKTRFNADVYIDDAPHNLLALQKIGKTTITFDQRYNQEVPGLRASNWQEVREILRELFGR